MAKAKKQSTANAATPVVDFAPAPPIAVVAPPVVVAAPVVVAPPASTERKNEFGYPIGLKRSTAMMQQRCDILQAGMKSGAYGPADSVMFKRAQGHYKASAQWIRLHGGTPTQDVPPPAEAVAGPAPK
jgi:hypothetical protein